MAFSLLSLLSVEPGTSTLIKFAFGIFLLSAIVLSTSTNILLYILSMYLINKGDYETKYPRFAWLINRYKKTSSIYLVIEIILFYVSLSVLIIYSIYVSNL